MPDMPVMPDPTFGEDTDTESAIREDSPSSGGLRPSSHADGRPSRRLSLLVEGKDYLEYRSLYERILFPEKMTNAQKDAEILKLAMEVLQEKVEYLTENQGGDPFIEAYRLRPAP